MVVLLFIMAINDKENKTKMKDSGMELYKRYRPQTWDDVIGQDKVVESLKNDVVSGRDYAAYLFAGPRGCGKTTLAWILAKAKNCENLSDDGSPCNECSTCRSINNKTNPGVQYISAANSGGVADVRSIMNRAYRRSTLKKQVWIIDEIQNFAKEAFDACLIPIEDENMKSLFIFCTTAISKIPETFTSRVQQREIRLVSRSDLGRECMKVLGLEGWHKVDEAERLAASNEDRNLPWSEKRKYYSNDTIKKALKIAGVTIEGGSVRQTLSALEQVLTSPDVESHDWTTIIASDIYRNTSKSPRGDATKAILDLSKALADGEDPKNITSGLIGFTRDLLVAGHSSGREKILASRRRAANEIGEPKLLKCIDQLAEATFRSTMDAEARVYLEQALVKMGIICGK